MTEGTIQTVKQAAIQQYRDRLLEPFSAHHHTLLKEVNRLTDETEPVTVDDVYDRYHTLYQSIDYPPLSARRISDFLKHLEQLDIIEADYHYGGQKGKTREMKISEF